MCETLVEVEECMSGKVKKADMAFFSEDQYTLGVGFCCKEGL